MARSRARPETPVDGEPSAKRQKTLPKREVRNDFYPGLLEEQNVARLRDTYAASEPFKHVLVEKLFDDMLLRTASEEIIRELHFTEKETDIYKVHQTGDLASLSYLEDTQLKLLPSLLALRDALYSPEFRGFVRSVTGCGPLSGKTQDMSVNSYRKGCHLLNHDDVIGTRRVSYILYMPLPYGDEWRPEFGGALELYPMLDAGTRDSGVLPEPDVAPSKVLPPAWNQFVFFEIQPGKSFHSVEEVVIDVSDNGHQRLSISGWFHKPQEGEDGYADEADAVDHLKSSLEQLSDPPTEHMVEYPEDWDLAPQISKDDLKFLGHFLNPAYLSTANIPAIAERFARDSELQLQDFLCEPIASRLEAALREGDLAARNKIPPHGSGVTDVWHICGPPHKRRFCVLSSTRVQPHSETQVPQLENLDATGIIRALQDILLPSRAFRSWLFSISRLVPLKFHAAARRFRPGLDYTLATATEDDARLDVVLDLTPRSSAELEVVTRNGKSKAEEVEPLGWESGDWGGWVCYMAPHDGEEDPAVYRSGGSSRKGDANGSNDTADDKKKKAPANQDDDEENDEEMEREDQDVDDSGTLLTVQPGFNRLLLVLRDPSVMHFVKYVSAAAEGSRWDICGEWEVGMVADEDEDDGNDNGGDD